MKRAPYISPLDPSRDDGKFRCMGGVHPWWKIHEAARKLMGDHDWKPRWRREAEWGSDYWDAEKRK